MRPNESVAARLFVVRRLRTGRIRSPLAVVHDIVCPCARPVIAHHHYQEP
jgi:hypothetical protein